MLENVFYCFTSVKRMDFILREIEDIRESLDQFIWVEFLVKFPDWAMWFIEVDLPCWVSEVINVKGTLQTFGDRTCSVRNVRYPRYPVYCPTGAETNAETRCLGELQSIKFWCLRPDTPTSLTWERPQKTASQRTWTRFSRFPSPKIIEIHQEFMEKARNKKERKMT